MGHKYVLKLLFCEKSSQNSNNQQPLKLRKNKHSLESLEFLKVFDACVTKFKDSQILLNKIGHKV